MEQMRAQAEHVGTVMVSDHVIEADLSKRPFILKGDSGTLYSADTLGDRHRREGEMARDCLPKKRSRATASPPARPATGSSIAVRRSW